MVELRVCHYPAVFTLDSRADVSVSGELNESMGFELNDLRQTSFETKRGELKIEGFVSGQINIELKTIGDLKA